VVLPLGNAGHLRTAGPHDDRNGTNLIRSRSSRKSGCGQPSTPGRGPLRAICQAVADRLRGRPPPVTALAIRLLVGIVIVAALPGVAHRIGAVLAREDAMAPDEAVSATTAP